MQKVMGACYSCGYPLSVAPGGSMSCPWCLAVNTPAISQEPGTSYLKTLVVVGIVAGTILIAAKRRRHGRS